MNVTNVKSNNPKKRSCIVCDSPIVTGNAKRIFCSDACKSENYRRKQSRTIKQQGEIVQQQQIELDTIKASPIIRTESVREVNPSWQLAHQNYQAQKDQCESLKRQLSSIEQDRDKLTNTKRGANLGMTAGLAFVMMVMAFRYDTRKDRLLGASYLVVSIVGLIAMGFLCHFLGNQVHKHILTIDGSTQHQKQLLTKSEYDVRMQLESQLAKLAQLQSCANEVPQYSRETITEIDEVRSPIAPVA